MSSDLLALEGAETWLTRREPRLRILGAILFALMTVNLHQLSSLTLALALAFGLTLSAALPPRLILRRLLLLEGFMLLLLVVLPFSVPGRTLLQLGPWIASREGGILALSLLLKANTVVLCMLALIGTLEPVALGHSLARLRLPDKLVHLLLFTLRYLGLLNDEYRRLRQAMRSRGFRPRNDRHTWRSLGWLMGMLLVRSLERARRVVDAMKCRGFNGRFYLLDSQTWRPSDTLFAILGLLLLIALLTLDRAT